MTSQDYKATGKKGLFDEQFTIERLSAIGNPLEKNKIKSKTRVRVEHLFGFMEQSMNGLTVKCVGIARATGIIGLINFTYNLFGFEQVQRLNLFSL